MEASEHDCTYTLEEAVNKVGYGFFQHKLLFLSGLAWAADAFEVMVLSVIGQLLACDWQIYRWQLALLSSCVFLGMMAGSPVFGIVADKYGRKTAVISSLALILCFGAASAVSPSYYWMLVFRTCTGIGLSGLPQGLTLCCEYFPTNIRGKAGFYLCYFWSAGSVLIVLICWVVMEQTGSWRLLLGITCLPSLIVLFCLKGSTESARYCMVSGKFEKAEKIMKKMAKSNNKDLPPGRLQLIEKCEDRGCITDLFTPKYIRSTLLLCYVMAASAFSYYGVAFMSPILIQKDALDNVVEKGNATSSENNFFSMMLCEKITRKDYIDLLWTSAAELPGILLFTITIEKFRRKTYLSGACFVSVILILLLLVKTNKKIIVLLLLFGSRGILVAIFQLVYVIISEDFKYTSQGLRLTDQSISTQNLYRIIVGGPDKSFPTTLRAVAMGLGGTTAKVGGLLNSYVSQVLIISHPTVAICILSGAVFFAAVAALYLPLETRGMVLLDSHIKEEKKNER